MARPYVVSVQDAAAAWFIRRFPLLGPAHTFPSESIAFSGTTFVRHECRHAEQPTMSDRPTTVLLVEDNPGDARPVRELLASHGGNGFSVVPVESLSAAMNRLDRGDIELVLLDLGLPDGQGLETFLTVHSRAPEIPVVLLTGSYDEAFAVRAVERGAQDCMAKGTFDGSGLTRTMRHAVERKRAADALQRSEQQYRRLVDNALVGVYQTNLAGDVLYVNDALLSMLEFASLDALAAENVVVRYANPEDRERFIQLLTTDGKVNAFEVDVITNHGHRKPVYLTGAIEGDVISGMMVDITERRRVQATLRLRSAALEAAANAIVITDRGGVIEWVNPAFTAMTGYTAEEAVGQNPRILKSGKHGPALYKQLWDAVLAGRVWHGELINKRKDRSLYTEEQWVTPVSGDDGEILHFVAIKQDITERKRVEAERDRLATMLETTTDFASIADERGQVMYVNRAGRQMVGMDTDESVTGLFIADFHPEWTSDVLTRDAIPTAEREGTWSGEIALKHRDGHEILTSSVVIVHKASHGAEMFRAIIARDIRAQKAAEEAIREGEERYRRLVEIHPESYFFYQHGRDGVFTYLSASVTKVLGFSMEESSPHYRTSFTDNPINREAVRHTELGLRGEKQPPYEAEVYHIDGSKRTLEIREVPVRDGDGAVVALEGLAHDVTERKEAEQALRQSETRYRNLVENAIYGIYRSTIDGRFLTVNRALVEMLGYESEEELLAIRIADLYDDPKQHAGMREQNPDTADGIVGVEVDWKCKDGSLIAVRLSGRRIRDAEGNIVAREVIAEDASERRRLEDQLRQAQKLEAVGRLAGGVAHDFNNLLTVVLGESAMALRDLPDDHPLHDPLKEIHAASERAEGLTRQLLAFSRKQIVEPEMFDVNQLVAGLDKMLRRLIGEDLEMTMRMASDPVVINADRGQIEQVMLNLVVNARDAMPEGGQLAIETDLVTLGEDYAISRPDVVAGDYACISVSDTGMGMTAEAKAQLFEPFFTTKDREHGSGLGLAVCYGIVKQFGGHIAVYSELGLGSTMKVYLPRAAGPAETRPGTVAATPPRGSETILFVEDDAPVRGMGGRILRAQGYQVLEAGDGEQALQLLEGSDDHVQLLLCDVVMPKMGGRVLANRVKELRPDIKVLFVSGYTDDVILRNQLLTRNATLLQKPFTPAALASKVRKILDGDER